MISCVSGVRIYLYQKGFLHSKLMVSDDILSTVGSTNMDFRSFEHNFEVNAFMYDVETALEMKEIFLQDQRESTQILLEKLGKAFMEAEGSGVCCSSVGSATLNVILW